MSAPRAAVEVVVRRASAADCDALIELARRAWLSAFCARAPFALIDEWQREGREAEWYPAYFHEVWLAQSGAAVVGLVQPRREEINGLWVHPSVQGRGVGTRLLDFAERRIAAAGYEKAWLTCSQFNQRAGEFYAARGYVEVRRYRERAACGVEQEFLVLERAVRAELLPER
jgi:ribosomal protein S18 acetylase RimI-like enzyme